MTIPSSTLPRKDYVGVTGAETVFPYDWLIFATSDLRVLKNGVVLVLTTDYTVSGVDEDTGGNVTLTVALPIAATLTILSNVPATQGTSFAEGFAFPARTVERTFDRMIRVAQQVLEKFRRAPTLAESSTTMDLVFPNPLAGKVIGWNSGGTALENKDASPAGPTGPTGATGPTGPAGAGAAPPVREVDGAPSIAVPTAIEFANADGFVVSEPSANVARVSMPFGAFGATLRATADAAAARAALVVPGLATDNAYTGRQKWGKGADLTAASTVTPGTDGNFFTVTGNTTITALAALQAGTRVLLRFTGTPVLTHNGTSLILQGGTNLQVIAGDLIEFLCYDGTNWAQVTAVMSTTNRIVGANVRVLGQLRLDVDAGARIVLPVGTDKYGV